MSGKKKAELLDICREDGMPSGETADRERVHREGLPHRTAHVWIAEMKNGRIRVLLQKRSRNKDSWPGKYDTSSAGHIPAGQQPVVSALRELYEELGIRAEEKDLAFAGTIRCSCEKEFYGKKYTDNEFVSVYVLEKEVKEEDMRLQEEEVEAVSWFDIEEVRKGGNRFCVPKESLDVLEEYLRSGSRRSDRSHAG